MNTVDAHPTTALLRRNIQLSDINQYLSQMLLISIPGTTLSAADQDSFQQIQPGGVILMDANISSADQVRNLVKQLQSLSQIPLIIAIDQEGGPVSRLSWDTSPGPYELRNASSTEICRAAGQRADILSELGINFNLAPVADLSSKPSYFMEYRSFGSGPQQVAKKTAVYIRCQQAAGVAATAKHFPGHRTSIDSHLEIPIIDTPYETWLQKDAVPFIAASKANTTAVLVGHLIYTDLDANRPASLSRSAISVLTDDLGFEGLVITDDLNMLRSSTQLSDRQILIRATDAGNHLLMNIQATLSQQLQFKNLLQELATTGRLNPNRLHATIEHILKAKRTITQ